MGYQHIKALGSDQKKWNPAIAAELKGRESVETTQAASKRAADLKPAW